MRTTLTIDDDLGAGLGETRKVRRRGAPKIIPHSFGFRPGIDLDKLGQLADELEAESFATSAEGSCDPVRRQRSRSRA